ncbi:MAG: hypothetical protein ACRDH2_21085 [Anaerolineales bacterium]
MIEIVAILGGAVGLFLPLGGAIGWWQGAFQLGRIFLNPVFLSA